MQRYSFFLPEILCLLPLSFYETGLKYLSIRNGKKLWTTNLVTQHCHVKFKRWDFGRLHSLLYLLSTSWQGIELDTRGKGNILVNQNNHFYAQLFPDPPATPMPMSGSMPGVLVQFHQLQTGYLPFFFSSTLHSLLVYVLSSSAGSTVWQIIVNSQVCCLCW